MSDPVLKPTQEQRQRLLPCPFCGSSAGATTTHIYCQSKTCAILHIPFTLAEWQGRRSPDEAAPVYKDVNTTDEAAILAFMADRPADEIGAVARRADGLKGTDAEGWIIGDFILRVLSRAGLESREEKK